MDENRVRGGHEIIRLFQPDVILLDDGFQHRRLARDINIAVINAKVGFGNGQLLPAGPLREPVSALKRANLIWYNQSTATNRFQSLHRQVARNLKIPVIYSDYVVLGVATIPAREHFSPGILKQKKILAFSGIANPGRFKESLLALDVSFVELMSFPDHHLFSDADFAKIKRRVRQLKPDFVLTTEKDAMRLPENIELDQTLCYLAINLIVNNENTLKKCLSENI